MTKIINADKAQDVERAFKDSSNNILMENKWDDNPNEVNLMERVSNAILESRSTGIEKKLKLKSNSR